MLAPRVIVPREPSVPTRESTTLTNPVKPSIANFKKSLSKNVVERFSATINSQKYINIFKNLHCNIPHEISFCFIVSDFA